MSEKTIETMMKPTTNFGNLNQISRAWSLSCFFFLEDKPEGQQKSGGSDEHILCHLHYHGDSHRLGAGNLSRCNDRTGGVNGPPDPCTGHLRQHPYRLGNQRLDISIGIAQRSTREMV